MLLHLFHELPESCGAFVGAGLCRNLAVRDHLCQRHLDEPPAERLRPEAPA